MDLGYFGEENLDLPEDSTFIGVGHSLGLIKLASLNVKFNALIGIQAFVNFLGFDLRLHKKRELELKAMIQHFQMDPVDTLISFHKRCGVNYNSFNCLNKAKLMQDLELLTTSHQLPHTPLLILGAMNDTIVSQELIYDNFNKDVKVAMHSRGYHSLGLCEHHFVYEQIISFCNGITKEIHTEQF
ncbi:hypothetical protein [Wolbachia endosymbiont of Oedothorax gibbosus]|uniref:hypothetical protein n=1 Tax=Wolbachia endosymbiont of Oedothorax gibbosus TaxID=931100 RepID=UPI0020244E45|nr:hypothetical protein [Wolbachia endosymbiont of Oedothorax gibbosus]